MRIIDQIHCYASSLNTFANFYCSQKEVKSLRNKIRGTQALSVIVTAKYGSGLSHFLHAICNENIHSKATVYISSQWLIHGIKKAITHEQLLKFEREILENDLIVIDNIQVLYRKKKIYFEFLKRLSDSCRALNKQIILGYNSENNSLFKIRKLIGKNFEATEINTLNSIDIFKLLKNLCSKEDGIPDNLIYYLSGFNGSNRMHINCLISLRFKFKNELATSATMMPEEIERKFNISSYYPQQQLRRSFRQLHLKFSRVQYLSYSLMNNDEYKDHNNEAHKK